MDTGLTCFPIGIWHKNAFWATQLVVVLQYPLPSAGGGQNGYRYKDLLFKFCLFFTGYWYCILLNETLNLSYPRCHSSQYIFKSHWITQYLLNTYTIFVTGKYLDFLIINTMNTVLLTKHFDKKHSSTLNLSCSSLRIHQCLFFS